MNWKKTFLILGLTAMLLLSLSACGSDSAPATTSPADNQTANSAAQPKDEAAAAPQEDPGAEAPTEVPTDEPQPEEPADTSAQISFSADVQPILESRCLTCHGGDRVEGSLMVSSYENLLTGGNHGQAVVPGDADNSYLAQLILEGKMPKRGPKLTPIQVETILNWINQGAANN